MDVIAGISNNWWALKFVKYERGANVWFKIRVSRKNNKRGRSDDWLVVCYISHKQREEKVKRCFCCSLMPSCCSCEEPAASFAFSISGFLRSVTSVRLKAEMEMKSKPQQIKFTAGTSNKLEGKPSVGPRSRALVSSVSLHWDDTQRWFAAALV